jgi:hypothetical protein
MFLIECVIDHLNPLFFERSPDGLLVRRPFPGEGLHFVSKIFEVSVGNRIVKEFLDDWFEVGQGMNRGQGQGVWWSQKPTQRTQQESRFDQQQRESALLQLMGVEAVPGTRQRGRFRELLIKTQDGAHVLFGVAIQGFHGFFLRAVASRWLSRMR